MNNMQYKVVDTCGNVATIFTNDAYDIVHDSRINGLEIDYKTKNLNLVINNLISNLVKTSNELNSVIDIINKLVMNNIISSEIGNYILQSVNIYNTNEQYVKLKKVD